MILSVTCRKSAQSKSTAVGYGRRDPLREQAKHCWCADDECESQCWRESVGEILPTTDDVVFWLAYMYSMHAYILCTHRSSSEFTYDVCVGLLLQ